MNHPLMLLHLITVILTLLVCVNVVSCGTNVTRARRTSYQYSWSSDNSLTLSRDDFVFIGDMAFRKQTFRNDIEANGNLQYSVVRNKRRIWPNAEVPYLFHRSVGNRERDGIRSAIGVLQRETCIRFREYDSSRHNNYLHIVSLTDGCFSELGYMGRVQVINLESGSYCGELRTSTHELMHTLGVFHEHCRYDRDQYIEVLWDNLEEGVAGQFNKTTTAEMTDFGEEYDYGSIMHYCVKCGTKYNLRGFRVLKPYDEELIGNSDRPSPADIRKLSKLYGCNQTPDDDNDGPIIPQSTRPPAPKNGGCDPVTGCCVTCNCSGFFCSCNSACNCHCTCYFTTMTTGHCNCNCSPVIHMLGLPTYQLVPQANIIYAK